MGSEGLPDLESGHRLLQAIALADAGDLATEPGCTWEQFAGALTERMHILGERAKLLLLGGDHSVTLPALRALAERHPKFGLLHFDAHGDFGTTQQRDPITHANVMRHALAMPQVAKLVQVGVRGFQTLPSQSERYRRFTAGQVHEDPGSIPEVLDDSLPWYVSVDIDVLDPALAPATGAPEPDGLDLRQMRDS